MRPERRPRWRPLLAVLAAFSGQSAVVSSSGQVVGAPTAVSARDPLAGCDVTQVLSNDPPNRGYVVEPYVGAAPRAAGGRDTVLVAVWQQDRLAQGFALGIAAGASRDGGRIWRGSTPPFDACSGGSSLVTRATDPWVSVGPDGTVYASAVAEGGGPGTFFSGVLVATSSDWGQTWSAARVVGGPQPADKDSITADPYHPGTAYVIWNGSGGAGSGSGDIEWVSHTTDGGGTWSTPRGVVYGGPGGAGNASEGNQLLVAHGGHQLLDFFGYWTPRDHALTRCARLRQRKHCVTYRPMPSDELFNQYIAMNSSTDGGDTWTSPEIIAQDRAAEPPDGGWVDPRNGRGLPDVAIDPRRHALYIVWQDGRFNGNAWDGVAIAASHDYGKHWSRPAPVTRPFSPRAFDPSVAVNSQGVVGVTYYTVSRWSEKDPTWPAAYWFVSSRDGIHFGKPIRLGGPFDIKATPQRFVGDYQGLVAAGKTFHPLFVLGNDDPANPTSVFTTTVTPK